MQIIQNHTPEVDQLISVFVLYLAMLAYSIGTL